MQSRGKVSRIFSSVKTHLIYIMLLLVFPTGPGSCFI